MPTLCHLFVDGQGLPALGLTHASLEGKNVFEAFPPEIASALAPCYQAALRGEQTALDLHHGSHTYRADIQPVRYGDEATGMVVMQDVTEQRRAQALAVSEAALRTTNEQLEAVSRAKSDFLSIVSHEVRTPLGSIRGFSEMLRDDDLSPDERIEYAGLINAEAQRLGRLVEDLLDLDRLESGRVDLRLERVDLCAIVMAALEQAAPTTNGHVLRSAVEPSLPPLRGDPDKLAQIVGNLVANAIKYSPHGGAITVGADLAKTSTFTCGSRTKASASRRRCWKRSSSGTLASSPPSTARSRGPGWGCRSSARSPSCTAAGPGPRASQDRAPDFT